MISPDIASLPDQSPEYAALVADYEAFTTSVFDRYSDCVGHELQSDVLGFHPVLTPSTPLGGRYLSLTVERATAQNATEPAGSILVRRLDDCDGASEEEIFRLSGKSVLLTASETDAIFTADTGEDYLDGPETRVASATKLKDLLEVLTARPPLGASRRQATLVGRLASAGSLSRKA